jgi:Holliday junction resolvasome RuvABC ATP-dependent DNA helicase subunit
MKGKVRIMENFIENYRDIDITDKTILQEQINFTRKEYFTALEQLEMISSKISKLKEEISKILIDYYQDSEIGAKEIASKLKEDEEYQKKTLEVEAYQRGMSILTEKIAFYKSDMRILSNSMYNKF